MQENTEQSTTLSIDETVRSHFGEIAKWARFLGITGLFFCALLLLSLILMGSSLMNAFNMAGSPYANVNSNTLLIAVAFFLLFPLYVSFILYRFGNRLKVALTYDRQDYFNSAFHNLKLAFRLLGIFAIIYLVLSFFGPLLSR